MSSCCKAPFSVFPPLFVGLRVVLSNALYDMFLCQRNVEGESARLNALCAGVSGLPTRQVPLAGLIYSFRREGESQRVE